MVHSEFSKGTMRWRKHQVERQVTHTGLEFLKGLGILGTGVPEVKAVDKVFRERVEKRSCEPAVSNQVAKD